MSSDSLPAFPKKLFYKIAEVTKITGIDAYVLRYWESKFPMLAPEKDSAGQRRYRQQDVEMVFRIKELLYKEKYTIAGAVEKLEEEISPKGKRAAKTRRAAAAESYPAAPALFEAEAAEGEMESGAPECGEGAGEPLAAEAPEPGALPSASSSAPAALPPEFHKRLARARGVVRELLQDLRDWGGGAS